MSKAPSSTSSSSRRTFWQRRVRDPIVAQLTQGITPEKISLTLAVGSAFALFPVLGTTTLLCFIIAIALRLNQPIVQLINQVLWPVHIPAILGCIWLGETMFGAPHMHVNLRYLRHVYELLWHNPQLFIHEFGLTASYAVVAWSVITPFYVLAVYFIAVPIMREITYLKHKAEAVAAAEAGKNPPVP